MNFSGTYDVEKELGLLVCHNGTNDTALPVEIRGLVKCEKYIFPRFVKGFVSFLWVVFAFQMLLTVFWTRFFWMYPKIRRSIFRFADKRPGNGSNINSIRDWLQRNICCFVPRRILGLPSTILMKTTGVPEVDSNLPTYGFYSDFLSQKIVTDDVRFGHKIFRVPNPFKWNWIYRFDRWISPKTRIIFSYTLILTSILGLVADFFIDIKFLQDLSTETLVDITYIHLNDHAIMAMAIYEIPVMLATPLTAYVVYKMAWSHNIQSNLFGEILIISLGYVLEDGPEMFLQYFYVDKYSGTNYDYPDGFKTGGRSTVVMSSLISFFIALFNIINLISMYGEFRLYDKIRNMRKALLSDDLTKQLSSGSDPFEYLVPVVWELKKMAEEEQMTEKLAYDIYLIERHCRSLAKKSKKPRRLSFRRSVARAEEISQNRPANKKSIDFLSDQAGGHRKLKYILITFFVLIGVLPFLANLLRLASSCYQMFRYRKYKQGCLKYEVIQSGSNYIATVRQPWIFDFQCWKNTDYVLIFGNFFALVAHFILLITIGVVYLYPNSPLQEFIDDDSDTESESDEENKEHADFRRKAVRRRSGKEKAKVVNLGRAQSDLTDQKRKKFKAPVHRSKSMNPGEDNSKDTTLKGITEVIEDTPL